MMQIGMRLGFPWINQNTKCPTRLFNFADGTNVLSPSINFSRTTNATVTNSAGLITYAPHNLLTYSEQFDNAAWQKLNGTSASPTVVANNSAAPNATLTADTVTFGLIDAAGDYSIISQVITIDNPTTYTSSFYVKANSVADVGKTLYLYHTDNGVTVNQVSIDLTLNYQRITSTGSFTAGTNRRVTLASLGSGLGGKNQTAFSVDVWGAQLEIGSSPTTYNSTTVKNLLGYSELFDNAAWTKSNSFVQTNLLTYSEAFDNAVWVKDFLLAFGSGSTANATNAPNGYQTADLITPDTSSNYHRVYNPTNTVTSTIASFSVYVKSNGYSKIGLRESALSGAGAAFDLSTGTVIGAYNTGGSTVSNMTITDVGNGWYRCSCSISFATSISMNLGIYVLNPSYVSGGNLQATWVANGTSGVYIWGAQLTNGGNAGDYRRTDSAALPVYYPNHNGVVCAEKLVEGTATSSPTFAEQFVPTSGAIYTASLHIKAAERGFAFVGFNGGSLATTFISVNLSTGAVSIAAGTPLNYSSVDVRNGYYRVSITLASTGTSASFVEVRASADGIWANRNYTGNGTSGIYIFGAQLSDSASLDPYVLNAAVAPTAAAYYGARFDYDPVTLQPKGLLIEEQRANLLTNSEDFTAGYSLTNVTVTANSIAAPDGTLTADKVEATTTAVTTAVRTFVATSTSHVFSIYVKKGSGATDANKFNLRNSTTATNLSQFTVNYDTGVITHIAGSGAEAINVGNNWWRIVVPLTSGITVGNSLSLNTLFQGSSETAGEFAFAWGAQLEAGAFATSYIPTAASQVTRAADVATIQGSNFYSWYNQNEGTIACSVNVTTAQSTSLFEISGASGNDIIAADYSNGAISQFRALIRTNGTFEMSQNNGSTKTTGIYKYALAYKTNNCAFTISGDSVSTDTAVNLPILSKITLVARPASAATYGNTTIQSLSYYPQRLSNDVLKGLTA